MRRTLALLAPLALAGAMTVGVAAPASAADASIAVTPSTIVPGLPTGVSGTCPTTPGALPGAAVVTVVIDGTVVADGSFPTDATGAFSGDIVVDPDELEDIRSFAGTAELACEDYQGGRTGRASTAVELGLLEADLAVTPQIVRLGGTVTVEGQCPDGSTDVYLAVGNQASDDPFFETELELGADPTFGLDVPVERGGAGLATPEVGPAAAYATCYGSPTALAAARAYRITDASIPIAVGFADFRVVAAPAPTPSPTTPRPTTSPAGLTDGDTTSGGSELASTGADTGPLALGGVALLLTGAGLVAGSRLRRRHSA
jgi:hypothetical protein